MAGSRIAWLALLGLALVATARASAPRVLLYNSSRVVASSLRTDLIVGLINDQVAGVSIRTTKSQPYLHELSAFSAYVIPANDKQPYLEAEDAGFNLWKPLELREYVQAGGSLVLLDGSTGHNPRPGSSGNSFTGMLDLLLGAEGAAHCKGYLYGRDLLMYLRLAGEGALGNIHTPIMVKPNRGLSGLACTGDQPGEPIYSGRADGSADAGLSAARLWRLGQGRIIWIGSSYTMPKIRAFREVLTAAIEDSQLPDLTLTRSPPPSPPPPRPPPPGKTSPPPPRPLPPSPPPVRSPPPPPPGRSSPPPPPSPPPPRPPPPSPPPPPPARSPPPPPPRSPSPPPPRPPPPSPPSPPPPRPPPPSPPPPPPARSPPPPPPRSPSPPPPRPPPPSPPPPPPARSPPPPPPARSPPPSPPLRSPPPSPPPPPRRPPPPPQRSPPPPPPKKSPPPLHGSSPPPADFVTYPPPLDYVQPPPLEDWSPPPPVKKPPPPRPRPPSNTGRRLRRQQ